jgi:glycosyltransferase involved in cell wall biosynthesis
MQIDAPTTTPLVTVYIPTRNRQQLVDRAIKSVLTQTYSRVEVLVVDDGSQDETRRLLEQLSELDDRVKPMYHEKPRGACGARNTAIRAARGDFVTGLDDDDRFLPSHIESLVRYWRLLDDAGADPHYIYFQAKVEQGASVSYTNRPTRITPDLLLSGNHIGNQIFAPKSVYEEAGLFDEEMPAWQDLELFFRVCKIFRNGHLLDLATYVFDESPRPDRVSSQAKERIRGALERMAKLHGNGRPAFTQRLLVHHLFGDHYSFPIKLSELIEVAKLGFWPDGYKVMLKRYMARSRR